MNSTNEYTLEQLGTFEKNYSFSRALEGDGEYRHIHYGDIHTKLPSVIQQAEILPTITENQNFDTVEYGDILIADASEDYKDLGKAVCFLDSSNTKVISGLHTHRFNPNSSLIKPEYLINLFQTNRYRKFVWRMGTGVSVLGLSKTNLAKYTVTIPCLDEQGKIAKHFMNINKKIQLQQEKCDLLKEQKKGYMLKVFNQELRFKDANGKNFPQWKSFKLNTFASKITTKNRDLSVKNVISNSAKNGLISQKDFFDKEIANQENIDGYYVISNGDFVYNPRISNDAPYGPINIYNGTEDGVVSPLYMCFSVKDINKEYLYHYFKGTLWYKYIYKYGDSGARHDRISIKDSIFLEMPVLVPSIAEQNLIANFISTLQNKIDIEEKKLDCLLNQKQAFMQQMFI